MEQGYYLINQTIKIGRKKIRQGTYIYHYGNKITTSGKLKDLIISTFRRILK